MANLEKLSFEDQTLLISIPYRVGIWMSNAEDVESRNVDDKREQQVLELLIGRIANMNKKMPYAALIARQIEKAKGQWKGWQQNAEEKVVFKDLAQALEICKRNENKESVSQYKKLVWQVALTVAQAYNENYDPDGEMHVNHFFEWIGGMFSGVKLEKAPENITAKEKTALKKLKAALKQ
jgi:hypothetical protein